MGEIPTTTTITISTTEKATSTTTTEEPTTMIITKMSTTTTQREIPTTTTTTEIPTTTKTTKIPTTTILIAMKTTEEPTGTPPNDSKSFETTTEISVKEFKPASTLTPPTNTRASSSSITTSKAVPV